MLVLLWKMICINKRCQYLIVFVFLTNNVYYKSVCKAKIILIGIRFQKSYLLLSLGNIEMVTLKLYKYENMKISTRSFNLFVEVIFIISKILYCVHA